MPAVWQIYQSNGIPVVCRVTPTEVRDRPHGRTLWVHKGICFMNSSRISSPAELIIGGIKGTTDYTISITVEWSPESSGYYSGVLDERTRKVTKGFTFDQKDGRNRATWTADQLSC